MSFSLMEDSPNGASYASNGVFVFFDHNMGLA